MKIVIEIGDELNEAQQRRVQKHLKQHVTTLLDNVVYGDFEDTFPELTDDGVLWVENVKIED